MSFKLDAAQTLSKLYIPGADLRTGVQTVHTTDGTNNITVIAKEAGRYIHVVCLIAASNGANAGSLLHFKDGTGTVLGSIILPTNDNRGFTLPLPGFRCSVNTDFDVALNSAINAGDIRVTAIGYMDDE